MTTMTIAHQAHPAGDLYLESDGFSYIVVDVRGECTVFQVFEQAASLYRRIGGQVVTRKVLPGEVSPHDFVDGVDVTSNDEPPTDRLPHREPVLS